MLFQFFSLQVLLLWSFQCSKKKATGGTQRRAATKWIREKRFEIWGFRWYWKHGSKRRGGRYEDFEISFPYLYNTFRTKEYIEHCFWPRNGILWQISFCAELMQKRLVPDKAWADRFDYKKKSTAEVIEMSLFH